MACYPGKRSNFGSFSSSNVHSNCSVVCTCKSGFKASGLSNVHVWISTNPGIICSFT